MIYCHIASLRMQMQRWIFLDNVSSVRTATNFNLNLHDRRDILTASNYRPTVEWSRNDGVSTYFHGWYYPTSWLDTIWLCQVTNDCALYLSIIFWVAFIIGRLSWTRLSMPSSIISVGPCRNFRQSISFCPTAFTRSGSKHIAARFRPYPYCCSSCEFHTWEGFPRTTAVDWFHVYLLTIRDFLFWRWTRRMRGHLCNIQLIHIWNKQCVH